MADPFLHTAKAEAMAAGPTLDSEANDTLCTIKGTNGKKRNKRSDPLITDSPPPEHYPLVKNTRPIRRHVLDFRKEKWADDLPNRRVVLDVLYHSDDFMLVNKPPNLLIDGDEWSVQEYLQRAYPQYPLFYLAHQIDYATSGIFILGLNKRATGRLGKLFIDRQVKKQYVAVVRGWVKDDTLTTTDNSTQVNLLIGTDPNNSLRMGIAPTLDDGKTAETVVYVTRRGYMAAYQEVGECPETKPEWTAVLIPVTLVTLHLKTGRRHQLRVHLSSIGHPIVGDPFYESTPPSGIPEDIRTHWPWRRSVVYEPRWPASLSDPPPSSMAPSVLLEDHAAPQAAFVELRKDEGLPVSDGPETIQVPCAVQSPSLLRSPNGVCCEKRVAPSGTEEKHGSGGGGKDRFGNERMLLHSRYVLMPLHRAKSKNARAWSHDLAVQCDPWFLNAVRCEGTFRPHCCRTATELFPPPAPISRETLHCTPNTTKGSNNSNDAEGEETGDGACKCGFSDVVADDPLILKWEMEREESADASVRADLHAWRERHPSSHED